jgi:integrase
MKTVRTWVIRWRINGQFKKYTIGDARLITLDNARESAVIKLGNIAEGNDPVAARNAWRNNPVVEDVAAQVLEFLREQGRSAEYVKEFERLTKAYILPHIGTMQVRDVTVRDLERIVHRLKDKTRTGNLVIAALSRMFKLAVKWTYRSDDPTYQLEKYQEHARERHLSGEEITRLVETLKLKAAMPLTRASATALLLLLYTGSRPKELLGATWNMFDLSTGIWTKPSQHTKQKKTHAAQLSEEALARLTEMRQARTDIADNDYLFPSRGRAGHLTTMKKFWATVIKEAQLENAHTYDLRKTFATLVVSKTDLKTAMKLTGHTQVQTLMKHYAMVVDGKEKEALKGLFDK